MTINWSKGMESEESTIAKDYKCNICSDSFDEKEFLLTNDENKCILHCEKNDWYDAEGTWDKKKINFFWIKIQNKLNNEKEHHLISFTEENITYKKVIFPKHQFDNEYNPYGCDEDLSSNFYAYLNINNVDAGLNKIIENKEIIFDNCTFLDILDLRRYSFKKSIKFISPIFKKEILLNNTSNYIYEFKNCKFKNNIDFKSCGEFKSLSFNNVQFYQDVNFMGTNFNFIEFINTIFDKYLNIYDCNINNYKLKDILASEITVNNTIFNNQIKIPFSNMNLNFTRGISVGSSFNLPLLSYVEAVYIEVSDSENISIESQNSKLSRLIIKDSIIYNIKLQNNSSINTLYLRNINIQNIFDIGGLNCTLRTDLENISFGSIANFLNIKIKETTRETARIIKDSFEQQNNIIEANKFYALEMKAREKELEEDITKGSNIFEWLVFKIHCLSSNHSQDWLIALFWIINISFSFFITEKNICLFGLTFISFIPFLVLLILGKDAVSFIDTKIRTSFLFILTFINYGIFKIISSSNNLDSLADKINPFSIMTGKEELTFGLLIYKIVIAYLLYQLIISIRQNTRRK